MHAIVRGVTVIGGVGVAAATLAACSRSERPDPTEPVVRKDGVTNARVESSDGVARKESTSAVVSKLLNTFDRDGDDAISIRDETMFRDVIASWTKAGGARARMLDRDAHRITTAADARGDGDGRATSEELHAIVDETATDGILQGAAVYEFESTYGYSDVPGSAADPAGMAGETIGFVTWNRRGERPATALPSLPDAGEDDWRLPLESSAPPLDTTRSPAAVAASLLERFDGDDDDAIDLLRETDVSVAVMTMPAFAPTALQPGIMQARRYDVNEFAAAADEAGDSDGVATRSELTRLAGTFDVGSTDDLLDGAELVALAERFGASGEADEPASLVLGNTLVAAERINRDFATFLQAPELPRTQYTVIDRYAPPPDTRGSDARRSSRGSGFAPPINPDLAFGNNDLLMGNSNFSGGID